MGAVIAAAGNVANDPETLNDLGRYDRALIPAPGGKVLPLTDASTAPASCR
jgi:hypothetical protein